MDRRELEVIRDEIEALLAVDRGRWADAVRVRYEVLSRREAALLSDLESTSR